jgi:succinyl-CoA synthetase beta subunit
MKLYRLYEDCDAELTEINPLVVTEDGRIVAADGRLNVDDSALYRRPDLKAYREDTLEVRLEEEARIKYVDVGGDIGILSSGAGMTMAVMDQVIEAGGKPANFLDGGIGMLDKAPKRGLELLMERGVNAILLSTYTGGRSDFMAEKLVEAIESTPRLNVPVIVRFQGLNQEAAEKILLACSYKDLHIAHDIDESARMAVTLARRAYEHIGK